VRSPEPEPAIRERIRELIHAGQVPEQPPTSIWAVPSQGGRPCSVCAGPFAIGETEYEVRVGTTALLLHLRCVELWAIEAEQRADVAEVIRAKMAMGELPSTRPQSVAMKTGTGEDCSACQRPISRLDVQYELAESGREFRLHEKCLRTWHDIRGRQDLTQ
jgi:hypothetical protein